MKKNNYEQKIWGGAAPAKLSLTNPYYTTLRYLLASVRNPKGKFLDIGCAGGALTSAIQRYFPNEKVIGLDFSHKSIKKAQKSYPEVQFCCANIENIPYGDNYFDFVSANHLLEHLENPKKALREINRVLKPGGIFYSATPLEGNFFSLTYWFRKLSWFDRNRVYYLGHVQKYNKNNYIDLMTTNGFKVLSYNWSGYSYQIPDMLYQPLLELLGKPHEYLLETESQNWDNSIRKSTYRVLRTLSNLSYNIEGLIFGFIPGFVIHLTARKNEKK